MRSSRLLALVLAVVLAVGNGNHTGTLTKFIQAAAVLGSIGSRGAKSEVYPAPGNYPAGADMPSGGNTTAAPAQSLDDWLFSQLENQSFTFASGAGGWATSLYIDSDGEFWGSFHDSDMGDTGADYPYGTMYICDFSGEFDDVWQVSDWEYVMYVDELDYDQYATTYYQDGVRYIPSGPYGMDYAYEIRVYLPGAPLDQLPEAFVDWVRMPMGWWDDNMPDELPFWGLYNVSGEQGFFGSDW